MSLTNKFSVSSVQWCLFPGFMGSCGDFLPLLPEGCASFCKTEIEKGLDDQGKILTQSLGTESGNILCCNPNDVSRFKELDTSQYDYFESLIAKLKSPEFFSQPRIGIGYSMGARILLQLAARNSDLFDAVIVLSAHPGLSSDAEKETRWLHDQAWARALLEEPWEHWIQRWNAQAVFGSSHKATFAVKERPSFEQRHHFARVLLYFSLAHQADLSPWLQSVDLPILWLVGERDEKFVKIAQGLNLAHGHIQILPQAYHRLFKDQPFLVKKAISEFLKNRLSIFY